MDLTGTVDLAPRRLTLRQEGYLAARRDLNKEGPERELIKMIDCLLGTNRQGDAT